MAKNLEKLNSEILAKLSFKRELCNYIYSSTYGRTRGYLYETDEVTYDKIHKLLEGSESFEIKKKDKVYILSGNPFPLGRIKEYLKQVGATITNDITKATVIAGNSNFEHDDDDSLQPLLSCSLIKVRNFYKVEKNSECEIEFNKTFKDLHKSEEVSKEIKSDYENGINCYLSKKIHEVIGFDYNIDKTGSKDKFFLTKEALEITYTILSKKVPVITEDYFIKNANSGLDLSSYRNYKSIDDMLNSSDKANINLGKEILINCKIDMNNVNTLYHIWRLSQDHYYRIANDHTKNTKAFLDVTNFSNYKWKSTTNFIKHCDTKSNLNKDIFVKLMNSIMDEISTNPGGFDDFYELDTKEIGEVSYKLKDKWLKILNNDTIRTEVPESTE